MITFLGDVFPKHHVDVTAALPGTIVINLEAPLTGHEVGYPGKINLRGDAGALASTFRGRDLIATLANNHCLDFYAPGVSDTIAALDELGVPRCGVGTESDAWLNPIIFEAGVKVAILAYADPSCTPVYATADHPGAAPLTRERVESDMLAARAAGAERVVVVAHWGEEHVALPPVHCIQLARSFIDAGADAVVGHHSHCIQSYETYRGKPIMYGLGNCIFPAHSSPSYYDAEGRPTRVRDTRPSLRNRRSLALAWEPDTGSFEVIPLHFDGARLNPGRFDHRRFRLGRFDQARYEVAYARAYRVGKLLHTIERFLARPKLPRLVHLRNFKRLVRSAPPT